MPPLPSTVWKSCFGVLLVGSVFACASGPEPKPAPAPEQNRSQEAAPDFLGANEPRARLMMLGTFHFQDSGLDAYKPQHGVDVRSPERQYDRNLRIFRNLQRLAASPDERVLLIIGAGHLPILQFVAGASPEFELVDVRDYLGGEAR